MDLDLVHTKIENLQLNSNVSQQLHRRYPSLKLHNLDNTKANTYLCQKCASFFPKYVPDKGQSFPERWPDIQRRYQKDRDEVAEGMKDCAFCTLLYSAFLDLGRDFTNDDDFQHFDIETRKSGIRPGRRKSGPRGRSIEVNSLRITHRCFRGHDLWLRPCANPVPSVDNYCQSMDAMSAHRWESRLSQRLVNQQADIRLLQRWLWLCKHVHGHKCDQPNWLGVHEQPSRLRLIDTSTMRIIEAGPEAQYIALSYVWGKARPDTLQMTAGNLSEMKMPGGVSIDSLPQTFKDAVRLTKLLGEKYLWIDALCIIQDDREDLDHQIAQMDLIYSRSILAIVAGSGDVRSGLPHLFTPSRKLKQDYLAVNDGLCLMEDHFKGIFGPADSQWLFRGWTYQENVLPRRCIFFFYDQIHWRCECDYWCETICLEPCNRSLGACQYPLGLSLGIVHAENRFNLSYLIHHILQYNVHREFTDEADTTRAFQGILNRISHVSNVKFHWGLPIERFAHALLWRDDDGFWEGAKKRRKCRVKPLGQITSAIKVAIPSWSWQGWRTGIAKMPPYEYQVTSLALDYERLQPRSSVAWAFDKTPNYIWTSSWYRVDIDGTAANLDLEDSSLSGCQDSEMDPECGTLTKKQQFSFKTFPFIGGTQRIDVERRPGSFTDSGRIRAWTSLAAFKIRPTKTDWRAYFDGRPPIVFPSYNVLNDEGRIIGMMEALNILVVTPNAREWSYQTFVEVSTLKNSHFIVISAEERQPFTASESDSESGEDLNTNQNSNTNDNPDTNNGDAFQVLINNMMGHRDKNVELAALRDQKRREENEKMAAVRDQRTRHALSQMVRKRDDFSSIFQFADPGDQLGRQILPGKMPADYIPLEVHERTEAHIAHRPWKHENHRILNLMMIDFDDAQNPDVASRIGLFKMDEDLWMKLSPEWRLVTLH